MFRQNITSPEKVIQSESKKQDTSSVEIFAKY